MVTTFFSSRWSARYTSIGSHCKCSGRQQQHNAAEKETSGWIGVELPHLALRFGSASWKATVEQSALTFFECANAAVTESSMQVTRTAAATAFVSALLRAYDRVRCAGSNRRRRRRCAACQITQHAAELPASFPARVCALLLRSATEQ